MTPMATGRTGRGLGRRLFPTFIAFWDDIEDTVKIPALLLLPFLAFALVMVVYTVALWALL